jgi:hypothetical protein
MNLDAVKLAAMREELAKLATQGYGPVPHEYEEMNKAKWKQTLKDVPVAVLGSAIGYGAGKTLAEYALPHLLSTPAGVAKAQKYLPATAAAAGGLSSYLLSVQRGMLKQRRLEADRKAKEEEAQQQKTAGARVPSVANATYKDPWRTDRRYPNRT